MFAPRLLGPFTTLVRIGFAPTADSLVVVAGLLFPFKVVMVLNCGRV